MIGLSRENFGVPYEELIAEYEALPLQGQRQGQVVLRKRGAFLPHRLTGAVYRASGFRTGVTHERAARSSPRRHIHTVRLRTPCAP